MGTTESRLAPLKQEEKGSKLRSMGALEMHDLKMTDKDKKASIR